MNCVFNGLQENVQNDKRQLAGSNLYSPAQQNNTYFKDPI